MKQVWNTSTTKIQHSSKNSWQSSTESYLGTIQEQVSEIKRNSLEQWKELAIWHSFHMYSRFVYQQHLLMQLQLLQQLQLNSMRLQLQYSSRQFPYLVDMDLIPEVSL